MKVLILSHSSEIGGGELSMLDFFDYWSEKEEIEPLFIVKHPVKKMGTQLKKRGWEYKALKYTSWSSQFISREKSDLYRNSKTNTRAIFKIDEIIKEFKPDLVVTNTIVAPWAAFAAKLNGLPHVWFVREYGDLDHGHVFETGREETFGDIGLLSELVVTNSSALAKHVSQYVEPEKVMTLYTPFKIEKIKRMAEKSVKNPFSPKVDIKIVMVGVVKPSKGQDKTIRAVAFLKKKGINAEVCIVGDSSPPEYITSLKKLGKELGVEDNVHFLGKKKNPYAYIKLADVGVMSSTKEAFGRVTCEYLALGKPVIGAASGGTLELVKDNENGFLFEPGNYKQIVEKIEFYVNNPDILEKHKTSASKTAAEIVHGKYSAGKTIKRIDEVIALEKHYRIPYFTRRWLNIPNTSKAPRKGLLIIPRLKRAKELGIVGSFQRLKYKINQKVKES